MDAPPRANRESHSRPSPVPYENESHTTSNSIAVQSSSSSHDKADSLLKHGPQGPHMVDKTRQHQSRQTFQIGNIFLYPDNGRVQDRVGSALQGHPALGNVVGKHSKTPHQHCRAVGNPPCPEETLTETTEQDGNSTLRQYVGGLQHQQGRRNQEQISLPPNCEAVEMVSSSPHQAPRYSSPRRGQCPSGLSVQEDLRGKGPSKVRGSSVEWHLNPVVCKTVFNRLERPLIDLFATQKNHQLPTYCTWSLDPLALHQDAISLEWTGITAYAFPPIALIPRVLLKLEKSPRCRMILIAPHWPRQMWFPRLTSMQVGKQLHSGPERIQSVPKLHFGHYSILFIFHFY